MLKKEKGGHVLVLPYPAQGHINPLLQFGKRLTSMGVKSTLAITIFVSKSMLLESGSVQLDTISDGYDHGGYAVAESTGAYLSRFQAVGSQTLSELITKHSITNQPITCIVYDAINFWALDVAKEHGLLGAAFFTQTCAVNNIYYYVHQSLLSLPISPSTLISIPGLPLLEPQDLPSFVSKPDTHPAYLELVLNQYSNVDKADFIFFNTIYELEENTVDAISKIYPVLTIGPTVPSCYSDNRFENDKSYGLNLFNPDSEISTNWLKNKPPESVIYASLGSVADLGEEEMEELAWGLKASNCYFLWVIRGPEQSKLPKNILLEPGEKGIIVKWSPQLEVLANEAVGCFLTHCGWNSTMEALYMGVPMVAMPQLADQQMNAKLIQDVWKVGKRVKMDDKGIVRGHEIVACMREVMHGMKAGEMKANAKRLSRIVKATISEGGTSDRNIHKFVSNLC